MTADLIAIRRRADLIAEDRLLNSINARKLARDDVPGMADELDRLRTELADAKRLGAPMAKVVLAHSPGSKCARAWMERFPEETKL